LNVGRGGVRVVLEDSIERDQDYELFFSDDATGRRVRVAWSTEQADGQIAGLKYLELEPLLDPRAGSVELSSASPGTAPGSSR
jgi:hypothetical protein